MSQFKSENCIRYQADYRDKKLYVIVGRNGIHLGIENSDEFLTLAAMAMVEELINEMLRSDAGLEDVAGLAFTASLNIHDMPRIIHDAIMYFLDREKEVGWNGQSLQYEEGIDRDVSTEETEIIR